MQVKFGPGILDARGSIGGVTFSRNSSGAYARARVKPVNPKTTRQVNVRAALAYLTDRWSQTLTAVQRTAWNLYASSVAMKNGLGETTYHSGFNHYIRSNIEAKLMNFTVVDAGPVVFELPGQDNTFSITASEATQQITAAYDDGMAWASVTGAYLFLSGGKPQNPQRNSFFGPWRVYGYVAGVDAAPPAGPHAGVSGYPIAELHRLWAYGRIRMLDGRLSEAFEADCFVGA